MKKIWRCTVCGYLHEGETPPAVCPVCHADASKFVLLTDAAEEKQAARATRLLRQMFSSMIPHAICAHFPSGLIPVMVLFLGLYLLLGRESFETTAFYLLVVAVLSVLPTIATGLYDWRTLFRGERATIFQKKIALANSLLVLGGGAWLWRWKNPHLLLDGGGGAWFFLLLIAGMLICVILLGHYGEILRSARFELKQKPEIPKVE